MSDPVWLPIARKYIGQKEIAGTKNNPLILKWWGAIRAPFTNDETPWCAGFVGGVLEEAGIKSSRSASARSYASWGIPLKNPVLGAILVFSRGPRNGHVGFYMGESKADYYVLGGNQSDQVSIVRIPKARCIAKRWPTSVPVNSTAVSVKDDAALSTKED